MASEKGIHGRKQCTAQGFCSQEFTLTWHLSKGMVIDGLLVSLPVICEPVRQEQSYISVSLEP